jgi:hypothetical protein
LVSGSLANVESAYAFDTTATVYNFEVEETHTYYVGTEGVLVHNQCIEPIKPFDAINFRSWVNNLNPAPVNRPSSAAYQYQWRVCGSDIEYRISLNNPPSSFKTKTIDVDHIDYSNGALVDAKYVDQLAHHLLSKNGCAREVL